MRLCDFDYQLPPELIAQFPPERRGESRLLHLPARARSPEDRRFQDLPGLLRPGDLLVFNDTRVMRARLYGVKESGGRVEVLVEHLLAPDRALAHVRASRAPRVGGLIRVGDAVLRVAGREGALFLLDYPGGDLETLMAAQGHMPLPPYIRREDSALDEGRYQTVYAERPGAVAAPTAGLHFDRAMLTRLAGMGVAQGRVTLHVGAGTFQPVRVERIEAHRMHAEWLEVGETLCEQVRETRARGGRVVAVGTTSVRSLETAAAGGELAPFRGDSRLFITPGYRFRVVDLLLTNFHLPRSTLLMLVTALGGHERVMAAYRHAVARGYRFFSYGDAMLVGPEGPQT